MGSCSLSRSARVSQTRKMPVEDDGLPTAAPAQPQGKAPASRPAVQAAAAQVPTDNAYKTPSASPASMRPRRQLAAKGRPTPESVDASLSVGQCGVWSLLSGLCWSTVRVGSDRYTGAHTAPRGASRFERTLRRFGSRKRCAKRRRVRPREPLGTNPGSQGIFMTHTTRSNF